MRKATVTALRTYQLCPRKYQYGHVEWLPADQAERRRRYALSDLLRAALADWYASQDLSWNVLDAALLARWDGSLFRDSADAARQYHHGRQVLWEKFSSLAASQPLRYEYAFDLEFGGGRFGGRIARIDGGDDGLELIDYRVDRNFEPTDDSWALQVYAAVAGRLLKRPVRSIRIILFGLQQPDALLSVEDPRAVETQVSRLRRAIQDDHDMAPRPGRHCLFCAFNQVCEAAWTDTRVGRRPNEMLRLFRAVEELVQCGETRGAFQRALEAACKHLGDGVRVFWRAQSQFSPELERVLDQGDDLEGGVEDRGGILVPVSAPGLLVPVEGIAVIAFPDSVPRGAAEVLGRSLRLSASRMASLHAATTDGLTGLARREVLERRLADSTRGSYALIICDIDHFKRVNDTRGHDAGDVVLRSFGQLLAAQAGALAHRLGGEEFCLMVPRSDGGYARDLAESLRTSVEALVPGGPAGGLKITASFGVAAGRPDETGSDVLKRADEALYRAKESGRNRVEVAG